MKLAALCCALLALVLPEAWGAPRARRAATCSIPYCSDCVNDDLVCAACGPREVMSSDKKSCLPCSPSTCVTCKVMGEGVTHCTACQTGYRLNTEVSPPNCEKCALGCLECDKAGAGKCDVNQCESGYTYTNATQTCLACSTKCTKCDVRGQGKCDDNMCFDRFVLSATDFKCKACGTKCAKCAMNGQGKCDTNECDRGYALTDTSSCQVCGSKCYECTTPGKCSAGQCYPTYVYNSETQECDNCAASCKACSEKDKCNPTECMEGYGYKAADGTCQRCNSHTCNKCSLNLDDVMVCDECISKYQKIGSPTCDNCPDHCYECSINNGRAECSSLRCETAYMRSNGLCYECPDKCTNGGANQEFCTFNSATNKTKCKTGHCDVGYQANVAGDGKCMPCPDGCTQCTVNNGKTECDYDYCVAGRTYRTSDKTCPTCPSNCATCFIGDQGTVLCSQCDSRYALNTERTSCHACKANCQRCDYDDASRQTRCLDEQCDIGYTSWYNPASLRWSCTNCPSGCERCTYHTSNSTVTCDPEGCSNAHAQNTISSINTCHECTNCQPTHCKWTRYQTTPDQYRQECESASCNLGYVRNSIGLCVSCPFGCKECTVALDDTTTTCVTDKCYAEGYAQILTKTCVGCPIGCATCTYNSGSNTITCDTCETGFVPHGSTCYRCPPRCNTCTWDNSNAKATCNSNQCQNGYTDSSGLCVSCAASCSRCDTAGPGGCDNCNTGFKLTTSGSASSCTACAANCEYCNTKQLNGMIGMCDTGGCKSGYKLAADFTSCDVCASIDNCETCVNQGGGKCDRCNRGYVVNAANDQCVVCPGNCDYCEFVNSIIKCRWGGCAPGYTMDTNRQCQACRTGCASCIMSGSSTQCETGKCKQGYVQNTANNNECVACPPNCRTCWLDNGVAKCDPHGCFIDAFQNAATGTCLACGSHCNKCSVANKCDVDGCDHPYVYDSSSQTCLVCHANCNDGMCTSALAGPGKCDLGQCVAGYGINSFYDCIACADHCATCNNIAGNGPGGGLCDVTACDATATPTPWTYHTSSKECFKCDPNCITDGCSVRGSAECDSTCAADYGLSLTTYTCLACHAKCASGCTTRAALNKAGECDSACDPGYYFNAFTCTVCDGTGCTDCSAAADTCTTCASTCVATVGGGCYALNPDDDLCDACDPKCVGTCSWNTDATAGAKCSPIGSGRTCAEGYRADTTNSNVNVVCQDCTRRTSGCITCHDDVNTCTVCDTTCAADGFQSCWAFKDDATCVPCDVDCSGTCTYDAVADKGDCDICRDGWGLTADGNGDCGDCAGHCDICATNGAEKCDDDHCQAGWVFHVTSQTCVQCDAQCTVASSCRNKGEGKCDTACNTGFKLDTGNTYTCIGCSLNCATCESNGASKCDPSGCNTGFGLTDNNLCGACSSYCDTCDVNGPGYCDPSGCYAGYAYDSSDQLCKKYNCLDGAYLQDDLNNCAAPPIGCLTANMQEIDGTGFVTICPSWACKQGYTWDSGTSSCRMCPSECETCYWPTGATTGTCLFSGCKNLHAFNNDVCPACPKGCDLCDGTGLTGPLDIMTQCKTAQCNSAYAEVTGTNTCVKCHNGGNTCAFNHVNNVVECTSARPTFVLLETTMCYPCPHDCDNCDYQVDAAQSMCLSTKCTARFAQNPDSMECLACPSNCMKCSYTGDSPDLTQCDTDHCDPGYTQDETTKACIQCPTDCKICKKNGTVTCLPGGCYPNKYQNPVSLSCSSCSANCKRCGTNHCLGQQCDVEYGIKSPEMTCNSCGTGCDQCIVEANGAKTCTLCKSEYVLEAGGCYPCPEACIQCTYNGGNTKCNTLKCKTGYTQDSSAARRDCMTCPSNCYTCTWNAANARADCNALQCHTGYANKDDGNCGGCTTNCVTCEVNGADKCDTCVSGYRLNSDQTCSACASYCYECSENSKCNSGQCHPRYTFDAASSTCLQCDVHCSRCTSNGPAKCDSSVGDCDTYYTYTAEDQTCTACPAHCRHCSYGTDPDGNSRLECHADQCDAYWGVDQKMECQECPDNCATCKVINDLFQCEVCYSSFVKNSGDCGACPSLCQTCSEVSGKGLMCNKCQTNAAMMPDKTCVACPSECATCVWANDRTECTSCKKSTHAIDANKMCTVCSTVTGVTNCDSCTNVDGNGASTCTSCKNGFTIKEDKSECMACSGNGLTNCNGCKDDPPTCRTCNSGFTPTHDRYQCGVECYTCTPSAENDCTSFTNDVKGVCPIGPNKACWNMRNKDAADVITHSRGCVNDTCAETYHLEFCQNAHNNDECKKCCDGGSGSSCPSGTANKRLLSGITESSATATTALLPVLLTSALAALLMGRN